MIAWVWLRWTSAGVVIGNAPNMTGEHGRGEHGREIRSSQVTALGARPTMGVCAGEVGGAACGRTTGPTPVGRAGTRVDVAGVGDGAGGAAEDGSPRGRASAGKSQPFSGRSGHGRSGPIGGPARDPGRR